MSLLYRSSTGDLFHNGALIGHGYSGHPPHVNDVAAQYVENVGPIPEGTWTVTAMEEHSDKHGPFVLTLTPSADTVLNGRQGGTFRMHGDSLNNPGYASEGCIIMPRPVRELVWQLAQQGDNVIIVQP